jgi:hypothetical protein
MFLATAWLIGAAPIIIPWGPSIRSSSTSLALHGSSGRVAVELEQDSSFSLAIKSLANYICSAYPDINTQKRIKQKREKEKPGILQKLFDLSGSLSGRR